MLVLTRFRDMALAGVGVVAVTLAGCTGPAATPSPTATSRSAAAATGGASLSPSTSASPSPALARPTSPSPSAAAASPSATDGSGLATLAAAAEQPLAAATYVADIKPENFPTPTTIDNSYYPRLPGTRYIYQGNGIDGPETITMEVTRDTKMVNGIKTVVVHDFVTRSGKLAEDTYDWYAQDKDGNVWYLGEDTHKLDDKSGTLTDTKGSWEFGKDNAQPGIIMPGKPKVGETYRQEYRKGEAEDQATILKTDDTATVKAGSYKTVVRTKDFSDLDPSVVEEKLFAPGVGFISVEHVKGPPEKIELVKIEKF